MGGDSKYQVRLVPGPRCPDFQRFPTPEAQPGLPLPPLLGNSSLGLRLPMEARPRKAPVGSTEKPFPLTHGVQGGFYLENN